MLRISGIRQLMKSCEINKVKNSNSVKGVFHTVCRCKTLAMAGGSICVPRSRCASEGLTMLGLKAHVFILCFPKQRKKQLILENKYCNNIQILCNTVGQQKNDVNNCEECVLFVRGVVCLGSRHSAEHFHPLSSPTSNCEAETTLTRLVITAITFVFRLGQRLGSCNESQKLCNGRCHIAQSNHNVNSLDTSSQSPSNFPSRTWLIHLHVFPFLKSRPHVRISSQRDVEPRVEATTYLEVWLSRAWWLASFALKVDIFTDTDQDLAPAESKQVGSKNQQGWSSESSMSHILDIRSVRAICVRSTVH